MNNEENLSCINANILSLCVDLLVSINYCVSDISDYIHAVQHHLKPRHNSNVKYPCSQHGDVDGSFRLFHILDMIERLSLVLGIANSQLSKFFCKKESK
jgi:hypothetical protein